MFCIIPILITKKLRTITSKNPRFLLTTKMSSAGLQDSDYCFLGRVLGTQIHQSPREQVPGPGPSLEMPSLSSQNPQCLLLHQTPNSPQTLSPTPPSPYKYPLPGSAPALSSHHQTPKAGEGVPVQGAVQRLSLDQDAHVCLSSRGFYELPSVPTDNPSHRAVVSWSRGLPVKLEEAKISPTVGPSTWCSP